MEAYTIGCIGKCTTGLKPEELDQITDNIHETLLHPKGRQIFQKYLERQKLESSKDCLELYEICLKFLDEENQRLKNSDIISSTKDMTRIQNLINISEIPQINMTFLQQFKEALNKEERHALVTILKDIKYLLRNFLKREHENFKQYILQPCPLMK